MAKELLVLLQLLLLLASCAHVDVSSVRAHQLGEQDAHTYVDHDQAKPWSPGPAPQPFAWVDNSCAMTPSSTPSLKSDDAAVASAQQRIQLTATAIVVNASELAYVKYAAEDLGSYLHSLGLSSTRLVTTAGTGSVNAVANSSTIMMSRSGRRLPAHLGWTYPPSASSAKTSRRFSPIKRTMVEPSWLSLGLTHMERTQASRRSYVRSRWTQRLVLTSTAL